MFTRREFTLRNTKGVMEQPLGLSDGAGRQDALAERGRFSENHRAGIQGVFVGYYLGERDADLVRIFPHHAVLFFFTGRRGFGSLAESLGHAVGESDHHVSGVWRITGGGGVGARRILSGACFLDSEAQGGERGSFRRLRDGRNVSEMLRGWVNHRGGRSMGGG